MGRACAVLLAMIAGCEIAPPPTPEGCRVGEFAERWRVSPPARRDVLFVVSGESAALAADVATELALGPMLGPSGSRGEPSEDLRVAIAGSGCPDEPPVHAWIEREGIGDRDTFVAEVRARAGAVAGCTEGEAIRTAARILHGSAFGTPPRELALVVIAPHDDAVDDHDALIAELEGRWTSVALAIGSDPAIREWDWEAVAGSEACDPGYDAPRILAQVGLALEPIAMRSGAASLCGETVRHVLSAVLPQIPEGFGGVCVPRVPIPTEPGELAPCELVETLGPRGYATRCEELPGREPLGDGRCRIVQRGPTDELPGWRLAEDPALCASQGTPVFVAAEPEPDAWLELRCATLPATDGCAEPP